MTKIYLFLLIRLGRGFSNIGIVAPFLLNFAFGILFWKIASNMYNKTRRIHVEYLCDLQFHFYFFEVGILKGTKYRYNTQEASDEIFAFLAPMIGCRSFMSSLSRLFSAVSKSTSSPASVTSLLRLPVSLFDKQGPNFEPLGPTLSDALDPSVLVPSIIWASSWSKSSSSFSKSPNSTSV